jgi:ATP-dependent DNA helicase RecG
VIDGVTIESQTIEWKEQWKDEYLAWISGFANSSGGTLVLGKNDTGEPIGVINAKKLMTDLPNKIRDGLGIIVEIHLLCEKDKDLIEIKVPAYPVPISYKGRYYIRSGATNQRLSGHALESFILNKRGASWDNLPLPGFTLDNISDQAVKHFKKLAAKKGRIPADYLDEPKENLLERLGLIKDGYLTNAAMLLFSEDPQRWQQGAYVKIGFFRNHADLEYQDEIRGPLIDQIDRIIEVIHLKYMKARITYEGIQRIERYFVPDEALREAILNAICHKDYSRSIPIQISVYDDQLYIGNVGRLPEHWTIDDLLGKHNSIPFNPDIANVFYLAGHIESWGRGIEKIFNACKVENVPEPKFKVHPGDIMIHFTAPKGFAELGVKDNNYVTKNDQDSDQDSDQDVQIKSILEFCIIERALEDIMKRFGMSHKTYFRRTYINPLLDDGLMRMTIPDKPTSRNQRYITTQKGQDLLGE